MTIIFDLSISNLHLRGMPYKVEILWSLSVLVFLLGLLRIRRRWQGIKDMNNFEQFELEFPVSKTLIKRGRLFTFIEILFVLGAITVFIRLAMLDFEMMVVMIAVLAVLALELIVFLARLMAAGKTFSMGINSKVIAYFSREMHLYFYTGLKRVELYQNDMISFSYKNDLVLFLPINVIPESEVMNFKNVLIKELEAKNIYYDDALRNWN
jgi:hypothetical protein